MKNSALHCKLYWSWTQLAGGRRFHLLTLPQLTRVGGTNYILIGFLFLELKLYFAERTPLPEITNEDVWNKNAARMRTLLERSGALEVKTLSKKLKVSSNSVKKLAEEGGYVIEDDMVFSR